MAFKEEKDYAVSEGDRNNKLDGLYPVPRTHYRTLSQQEKESLHIPESPHPSSRSVNQEQFESNPIHAFLISTQGCSFSLLSMKDSTFHYFKFHTCPVTPACAAVGKELSVSSISSF